MMRIEVLTDLRDEQAERAERWQREEDERVRNEEMIARSIAEAQAHVTVAQVVDTDTGVNVTFTDGAMVYLGVDGKSHCPRCAAELCIHHKAALPEWERRREELAQANKERWGPRMYRSIGLDPAEYLEE